MVFKDQADSCRRQARDYPDRPEGRFLLSVAQAFDDLATGVDSPNARTREDSRHKVLA